MSPNRLVTTRWFGLALDVLELDRAAAVHALLQAGHFQIRIDLPVGLDQVALRAQPIERGAPVEAVMGQLCVLALLARLGGGLSCLGEMFLHGLKLHDGRGPNGPPGYLFLAAARPATAAGSV
jgi:hypothetical protein